MYIENVLLEKGSSFYCAATTIGRGCGTPTTTTRLVLITSVEPLTFCVGVC